MDRDGLSERQVSYIEKKASYKQFQYRLKILPVNEIENFYLLDNDLFTDELIEEHKLQLCDAFRSACKQRINGGYSEYKDSSISPHGEPEKDKLLNELRDEALSNWRRLMPGKDISKLIENQHPLSVLKNADFNDLPEELQNYLDNIKQFFER